MSGVNGVSGTVNGGSGSVVSDTAGRNDATDFDPAQPSDKFEGGSADSPRGDAAKLQNGRGEATVNPPREGYTRFGAGMEPIRPVSAERQDRPDKQAAILNPRRDTNPTALADPEGQMARDGAEIMPTGGITSGAGPVPGIDAGIDDGLAATDRDRLPGESERFMGGEGPNQKQTINRIVDIAQKSVAAVQFADRGAVDGLLVQLAALSRSLSGDRSGGADRSSIAPAFAQDPKSGEARAPDELKDLLQQIVGLLTQMLEPLLGNQAGGNGAEGRALPADRSLDAAFGNQRRNPDDMMEQLVQMLQRLMQML